jgi:hypothetical protein
MPVVINGTTGITTPTESVATTIGVGGATPSASGAGITFPATQLTSTDANTLDDYEEGTWTPRLTDGTNNASGYASRNGRYTKIGNLVTVRVSMSLSNKGSLGSAIRIGDLPFVSSLNGFQGAGLAQANWSGLSGTLTGGYYGGEIYLYNQAATGQTNLSGTNLTNTSEFDISLTYIFV